MVMLQGSDSEIDYTDKTCLLKMLESMNTPWTEWRMLKRSGKLAKLKGLIVGAFNEVSEESIPFGSSPEQVIWDIVKEYDYPVCFNFPVGHIDDNRAMIAGNFSELTIDQQIVTLIQS